MSDDVLQQYEQRFGAATPPLDHGQHSFTVEELAALAAEALALDRPIPWHELLEPLPADAVS